MAKKKGARPEKRSGRQAQQRHTTDSALERGAKLHGAGNLSAAAAIYTEILRAHPEHDRALFLLGLAEFQQNAHQDALTHLTRASQLSATVPRYHYFLGLTRQALRDPDGALLALRRCRELDPSFLDARLSEGAVWQERGAFADAERAFLRATELDPKAAVPHERLGEIYLAQDRMSDAQAHFELALERDPGFVEAIINLGTLHQRRNQLDRARSLFARACELRPDLAVAHFNLGWVEQKLGLLLSAAGHFRRALALDPSQSSAMVDLAGVLHEICEVDEALALYRQVLARAPRADTHSSLLSLLLSVPEIAPALVVAEARSWSQLYAEPAHAPVKRCLAPPGQRPLRIGYVSPDFREHAVSYFFEPILQAHDPSRFEVTCYANVARPDQVTARLAARARMCSIYGRSDADVAEQIRADGIDILIDLAGHTLANRLSLFGHRAAPIQATYLGYPGTTGVSAIDYRFTDVLADPIPTSDASYTEALVRLPGSFCCFQPPSAAPEVGELPALTRGQVTFGSLNNYTKLSLTTLQLWSQVLMRVPGARLLLQSRPFADASLRERVWARFAQHGVARERVELRGPTPFAEHLRLHQEIDIGLDTFPWNGHTTTCMALHMGVPVLTMTGETFAARMGLTLLSHLGIPEWIAKSPSEYVELAVRRAHALDQLAELRRGLRTRLGSSVLCDAASFTRGLESAYLDLHQKHAERDTER